MIDRNLGGVYQSGRAALHSDWRLVVKPGE